MSQIKTNGFMVLHSNQLEGLRELVVEFIRNNPLPVLEPEVLLVQSNGMKHWLEIALAKELGICAATQVELPSRKLWQIYRAVLGPNMVPAHMPLDKSPLVWRIMRRLPELIEKPHFSPLKKYLGEHSTNDRRAYQLACQLADVLDGYQNYRSDWLKDWAANQDQLRTHSSEQSVNSCLPLPESQNWQPALWRDVLQDLSHDHDSLSPAYRSRSEVHEAFLQAIDKLKPDQRPAGVPQRLMVFGVTSLPMQTVEALHALGKICQVLMLVQNPCQYHWGHIVESKRPLTKLLRQRQPHKVGLPVPSNLGGLSESDQYTLHTVTHPLLASWGKHGRDYLHLLDTFDDVSQYASHFTRLDVFVDPIASANEANRAPTLLEHLQWSFLHLEPIPDKPREVPSNDRSIVMVQNFSAQREVEVLHDHLLSWLDEQVENRSDKKLQPSDIMVMVPDMEIFAPHIHAVFGRFESHDPRYLPYSVADTTPQTEPIVQALEMLLQLPQLRITRVEWQCLFEVDAVRKRFGLDASDVAQIDTWLDSAGVRWGLDTQHRKAWGFESEVDGANQNSWLFGLERLLLGYATGGSGDKALPWQNTLPQAGVGGLDAHVIEGLLKWLHHTQLALLQMRQDHTPTQWVRVLQQLIGLFFQACNDHEERLLERIMAPLETWLNECQLARLDSPLPLVVVHDYWVAQLQQSAQQRRFFGGGIQFATLMPMRSIPFKIVCLLGMNDGDYPRSHTPRDFDLMSGINLQDASKSLWRAGDRSRREDDRYLFLEALLSAREKLYISWQGRRTTDHEKKPPSVLVAQLIDYLNATWKRGEALAFDKDTLLQPLQAFSLQYFTQGNDKTTYAHDWQKAVIPDAEIKSSTNSALRGNHSIPRILTLQHLDRLLKQPVDIFIRDRLQTQLDIPQKASVQEEPFALNHLDTYRLTQTIAYASDPIQTLKHLRLSGELAIAGFGELQERNLLDKSQELQTRFSEVTTEWPTPLGAHAKQWSFEHHDLHAEWGHNPQSIWRTNRNRTEWLQIELRPGSVVEGKETQKIARTETLTSLWLNHLVACASGTPTTSKQIGLNGVIEFSALAPKEAEQYLSELVSLYALAWQQPLPVARKSACKYISLLATQDLSDDNIEQRNTAALHAAMQVFEGSHQRTGEFSESASLQRVFNEFSDIADALPHWADRIYGPIAKHAQILAVDSNLMHKELES